MKSDIKTATLKSFAWTITLILILASFVFITLITNSKSGIIQNNIRVLRNGNDNYRRIDTCISVLYVAENNSRLYAVTSDKRFLDRYTQQMHTVSSILSDFQEEKKKQSFFNNLYLPQLLENKQTKDEEFVHLKKMVDDLMLFRPEQKQPEVTVTIPVKKPYVVKTTTKIAKSDSVTIVPRKKNKKFWRRLVEAVSNKNQDSSEVKVAALKTTTTFADSLAIHPRKQEVVSVSVNDHSLEKARRELNKAELELLVLNNRIFSNLQSALKVLKMEEIKDVETLRNSILVQTSDNMTELDQLWWGNVAIVLILTVMILWNILRLYKSEKTILEYSILAVESAKKKGEFLSHVSHEIRTPLNSIIGFSRQIDFAKPKEDLQMKINAIKNSSDVLLMLVNEILDFSKFESGKIKLVDHKFHPLEMLENVTGMLSVLAVNKEIQLHKQFEIDQSLMLSGDDFRLKQVIINLITNAIKFTPQKGEVHVRARFDKIKDHQGMLKISVTDSGVGIEDKNLKLIFEDFTQIESSDERNRQQGTGLGLPICKRIVDLFEGTISVQSELGKGSVFKIEIPLNMAVEKGQVEEKSGLIGIGKLLKDKRVLMVDDIKINLLLLGRIMDKNAIRYDLASDGEEAYHLFNKTDYDLIITDVQMPKMDGLQLTKLVRNDQNLLKSGIPIIGYTGNVADEDRSHYLRMGMNDLLGKPFTESDLVEVLEKVIS
ncbi:hybrid sensor histidine kinase/response regulator [Dyadobacter subterraneus]|uniref:histidine kinase n=1 Tax=Dyadobacter subterraneus TaxID=2773304 RepID=A0ABR9WLE5_9BACT|nr:ATP-binding protein [Dyadobacter subterraneus]MBE9465186.1 response regulator [Dyadobacter subterraneus]